MEDKKSRPPPRCNEGMMIDAMQNAWRFVTDEALPGVVEGGQGLLWLVPGGRLG